MSRTRRGTVVAAGVILSTLVLAGPALAHLESSPSTVSPGSTVKVTFLAGHGCDGSPTTKLAIKLPAGVTATKPIGPKGFVGTVAGGVITFEKGTLGAKTAGKFTAVVTFPKAKGLLTFLAVQTCVKGTNNWIAVPSKAVPAPEHPAPQIGVGVPGPAAD